MFLLHWADKDISARNYGTGYELQRFYLDKQKYNITYGNDSLLV